MAALHLPQGVYLAEKALLNARHTGIALGIASHNFLSRSIASLAEFGLGVYSI